MHSIFNSKGKNLLNLKNFILVENQHNPVHKHNYLEISYIKEGTGSYHVENKIYDILPGDVFLFNNIESHGLAVSEKSTMTNMVIHFEPNFIWTITGDSSFDYRYLSIFFNRNENFENRLDRNNDTTKLVGKLLLEIEQEFINSTNEYQLMIKVMMLKILVLILRGYDIVKDTTKNQEIIYENLSIIDKIIAYLDSHITDEIQLETLGKIVHMNSSYLSTFFKRHYGKNIFEYITIKRIDLAQKYLTSTHKTILDIAIMSGFNSVAGFNKAFRKVTSYTPSEFRKDYNHNYGRL